MLFNSTTARKARARKGGLHSAAKMKERGYPSLIKALASVVKNPDDLWQSFDVCPACKRPKPGLSDYSPPVAVSPGCRRHPKRKVDGCILCELL
jgi:hypothetical protein